MRRALVLAAAAACIFAVLAVLVTTRTLAAFDLAVTLGIQPMVSNEWDRLAGALAIAWSTELTLVYAAGFALLLWRGGARWWSLAPLAFLALYPLELGLKLLVVQPNVPANLHRGVPYPLTEVVLANTFPSGHALRAGFVCTLAGALLAPRLGSRGVLFACEVGIFLGVVGFTRVYLGDHWLTDVLAGIAVGWALALPLAVAVQQALERSVQSPGQIEAGEDHAGRIG